MLCVLFSSLLLNLCYVFNKKKVQSIIVYCSAVHRVIRHEKKQSIKYNIQYYIHKNGWIRDVALSMPQRALKIKHKQSKRGTSKRRRNKIPIEAKPGKILKKKYNMKFTATNVEIFFFFVFFIIIFAQITQYTSSRSSIFTMTILFRRIEHCKCDSEP